MDPTAVAMILLSCGTGMQTCHVADTRPAIYAGMEQCAAALSVRLEGTGMVGRCQPVAGVAPGNGVALVRVVRGSGSRTVSSDYLVQRLDEAGSH
jgi:hypothetical protein